MSSKNILQRHITNIHCEEETILCEECGKFMSSKNILQRHMTYVHIHCEGEEATIDDGTVKGVIQGEKTHCNTIEEEKPIVMLLRKRQLLMQLTVARMTKKLCLKL